jgi:HD superfamily phosphohydrolase
MPSDPSLALSLEARVNAFVKWLFRDYKPLLPKGPKVFNDALLGNQLFAQHEVAVIDCPLLQRLKRVRQTGLVYHVFPSATHSRFEHSLGAAAISERCFNAIQDRASVENEKLPMDGDRYSGDLAHLRMAAMLHDVGHGLCSHASEQIYELLSDLQEFRRNPHFVKNAPGEILSYLIVTSDTFRDWFEEYVVKSCQARLNLTTVANLILGKHEPQRYFLAQIISSAYDCDKLDYIARDSYYCGLALTVDLPRFYSMISTAMHKDHRVLVLRSYVPLEQILFSKMTLFGSVYHHQKVKCIDSMLRSVVQHIVENPEQASVLIRGETITFADPVQYLYITDEEFFSPMTSFGDAYIQQMLNRFRTRDLFVRCLEISRRTVTNWDSYGRQSLIELAKLPDKLADVEKDIHKSLPPAQRGRCNILDIRLSIPGLPGIKTEYALIQTSKGSEIEKIEKYFPLEQWTAAYAHNKWRSFVYAPREYAAFVRDAAIDVLRQRCKLEIDSKRSDQTCHL